MAACLVRTMFFVESSAHAFTAPADWPNTTPLLEIVSFMAEAAPIESAANLPIEPAACAALDAIAPIPLPATVPKAVPSAVDVRCARDCTPARAASARFALPG
jgi:hypothetical protein